MFLSLAGLRYAYVLTPLMGPDIGRRKIRQLMFLNATGITHA